LVSTIEELNSEGEWSPMEAGTLGSSQNSIYRLFFYKHYPLRVDDFRNIHELNFKGKTVRILGKSFDGRGVLSSLQKQPLPPYSYLESARLLNGGKVGYKVPEELCETAKEIWRLGNETAITNFVRSNGLTIG
jgi:hypothetical protein